ncbi:hypothetical protein [Vibrio furnissii]|uniref:hypothetical protein n=1 Tax=Vibrio furnissii TaxID=29494 RepID=UPI001EEBBFBE|nr:hypothetical protein [Vibrio furnissii]MCG6268626.1 hypothetical protein [Vibrio furnissii]
MSIQSFLKSKQNNNYKFSSISFELNELFLLYNINADFDDVENDITKFKQMLIAELEFIINCESELYIYDDLFELYGNLTVNEFIKRRGDKFFKNGVVKYEFKNNTLFLELKKAV